MKGKFAKDLMGCKKNRSSKNGTPGTPTRVLVKRKEVGFEKRCCKIQKFETITRNSSTAKQKRSILTIDEKWMKELLLDPVGGSVDRFLKQIFPLFPSI